MRRRGNVYRDPTSGGLDLSEIDESLGTLPSNSTAALLLAIEGGLTAKAIAEVLGLTPDRVHSIVSKGASMLRHPSRSQTLRDEDDEPVTSRGLRRRLEELETSALRPCEGCGRRVLEPMTWRGGRPAKYCSGACRQQAYRDRRRSEVGQGPP